MSYPEFVHPGPIDLNLKPIGDGGPAYPLNRDMRHNADWDHEPGMSLRDRFALAALPAVYDRVMTGGLERVAKISYELADAMLKAREETPKE